MKKTAESVASQIVITTKY